jgi:CNT family concentrative nucleoside transporter
MLIAFIGVIALLDGVGGGLMAELGHPGVDLETLLGYAFAPLAWLVGVLLASATIAGFLLGSGA